jgi:palmitoyltransferase ZDHHC13/17
MTPLHWAAIGGEMRVIKALFRAGAEKQQDVREKAQGSTPQELMRAVAMLKTGAEKHRRLRVHRSLVEINGHADWQKEYFNGKFLRLQMTKGHYFGFQMGITAFYFFMVFMLQAYLYYYYLSVYTRHFMLWTFSFYAGYGLHFIFWLRLATGDPGFLPGKATHLSKDFQAIVDGEEEFPPHQELCVTCKILRPIRSKHCIISNKCVDRYDHYSPLVSKPIGRRNYLFFLGFLVSIAYESLSINVLYGTYLVNLNGGQTYWQGLSGNILLSILFLGYAFQFLYALKWIGGHLDYIRLGMTGNEAMNAYRYSYMKNSVHDTVCSPFMKDGLNEELKEIYNDCSKEVTELVESLEETSRGLQLHRRKQNV